MQKMLIFIGGCVIGGYVVYNELCKSLARTIITRNNNDDAKESTDTE